MTEDGFDGFVEAAPDSYAGGLTDGQAWTSSGNCGQPVVRGGSYSSDPSFARSALRIPIPSTFRGPNGFRVARTDLR